ncbi:sulfurtransferase TusA family protein [Streptomyces sp. NPDC086776]|uniref:sulfurtransferase TusA family protein n=1 Tax=Streptomyces sp. NPDC086776 TaxID=3365756 RepID=UPI0037FC3B07
MTARPAPAADIRVDGTGLLCVTLLLRLRAAIDGAGPGTVVHVIATDPAAPLDLPAWCHMTGHDYLGRVPDDEHEVFALQLAAGARHHDDELRGVGRGGHEGVPSVRTLSGWLSGHRPGRCPRAGVRAGRRVSGRVRTSCPGVRRMRARR